MVVSNGASPFAASQNHKHVNAPILMVCSSVEGKIFVILKDGSNTLLEVDTNNIQFKKAAWGHSNFLWGLSANQKLYVFVVPDEAGSTTIRVLEECYENERSYPFLGWSDRLLPVDRAHFSDADGAHERKKDDIHLPRANDIKTDDDGSNWCWEGPWRIDDVHNGVKLSPEGWTYAPSFNAKEFSPFASWFDGVRRRRWIRYRRYRTIGRWVPVSTPMLVSNGTSNSESLQKRTLSKLESKYSRSSVSEQDYADPFKDISVGGHNLLLPLVKPTGQTPTTSKLPALHQPILVWAVSVNGNVYVRLHASNLNPEGDSWQLVPVPGDVEIWQVSCGPTGVTCALTWQGSVFVRESPKTREFPYGTDWLYEIASPAACPLRNINVGNNALWALSDGATDAGGSTVWYKSMSSDRDWVHISGPETGVIGSISLTTNDQVFAVDADCQHILQRKDIKPSEPSGTGWRVVPVNFASPATTYRPRANTLPVDPSCALCNWFTPLPSNGPGDNMQICDNNSKHHYNFNSISANALFYDPHSSSSTTLKYANVTAVLNGTQHEWYKQIRCRLRRRIKRELRLQKFYADVADDSTDSSVKPTKLEKFEPAIDPASRRWIRQTTVQVQGGIAKFHNWTPNVEIVLNFVEQQTIIPQAEFGGDGFTTDDSECFITIRRPPSTTFRIPFSELTDIMLCYRPGRSELWLMTPTLVRQRSALKLAFDKQEEFYDWLETLNLCYRRFLRDIGVIAANGNILCTEDKSNGSLTTHVLKARGDFKKSTDRRKRRVWCVAVNGNVHISMLSSATASSADDIPVADSKMLSSSSTFSAQRPSLDCARWLSLSGHFRAVRQAALPSTASAKSCNVVWCIGQDNSLWCFSGSYGSAIDSPLSNSSKSTLNGQHETRSAVFGDDDYVEDPDAVFYDRFSNERYTQTDSHCVQVVEHERWNPIGGFRKTRLLPTDPHMWESGGDYVTKESFVLPSNKWSWSSDWFYIEPGSSSSSTASSARSATTRRLRSSSAMDFAVSSTSSSEFALSKIGAATMAAKSSHTLNKNALDDDGGWEYAIDFSAHYHLHKNLYDCVRRRRWRRWMRIVCEGPWLPGPPVRVRDVCFVTLEHGSRQPNQTDAAALYNIVAFALTEHGVLLRRDGITEREPLGDAWIEMNTPQPLLSITANRNWLYAVAVDGSGYYCSLSTLSNFLSGSNDGNTSNSAQQHKTTMAATSLTWFQIDYPGPGNNDGGAVGDDGSKLSEITVSGEGGKLWAVDRQHRLWLRAELSNAYPDGTGWLLVNGPYGPKVYHVSAGELDIDLYAVGQTSGNIDGGATLTGSASGHGTYMRQLMRRAGFSDDQPAGCSWELGIFARNVCA